MQNFDFGWKYSTFYDVFVPKKKTPMIAKILSPEQWCGRSLKHFSISWENVIFYVNTEKHKAARLHDYACSSMELLPSPWTSREALR